MVHLRKLNLGMLAPRMSRKLRRTALTARLGGTDAAQDKRCANRY